MRVKIEIKGEGGEVAEKWIPIKYDCLPKYCQTCKIQGHDEAEYYVKNPKLYKKGDEGKEEEGQKHESKGDMQNKVTPDKVEPSKQLEIKGDVYIEKRRKNAGRKQPVQ